MPDPTNPTSTTPTVDTTGLNNGADAANRLSDAFLNMASTSKSSADSLALNSQATSVVSQALGGLGNNLLKISSGFTNMNAMSKSAAEGMSLLATAFLGPSKVLDKIASDKTFNTLSSQITEVVSNATSLSASFKNIAGSFGIDTTKIIDAKSFQAVKAEVLLAAKNMGDGIDKSLDMTRAVFRMSAQGGQLKSIFTGTTIDLEQLNTVSIDYQHNLEKIAQSTGTTLSETGNFFNSLGQLPRAFGENAAAAGTVAHQMDQLQKIITLSRGTGQDFNTVLGQSQLMLENFNDSAEKAYDITARSSQLNQTYGVNIADTNKYLEDMVDSFKLLGDNTEGTTGIFEEMFSGLREGGLGIKPTISTIEDITKGIAGMNVAQKAFLSSRSGGPGGLLGSIQIEKELAGGNAQGVFDKLKKSFMQQIGGQVITRDEVQTQSQAAQFEKQRQLLKSSAFGGIAKTDEQASAILKAFSKPTQANLGTAKDILTDKLSEGANQQKTSNTFLSQIAGDLDEIKGQGGFKALQFYQGSFTEAGKGATATALTGKRTAAEAEILKPAAGTQINSAATQQYVSSAASDAISNAKGTVQAVGNVVNDLRKQLTGSQTPQQESHTQAANFKSHFDVAKAAKEHALQAQLATAHNAPSHNAVGLAARNAAAANHIPTAANAHPTPGHSAISAHPTTGTNSQDNATTVNVYIDGRKIMPDHVQASYGPTR